MKPWNVVVTVLPGRGREQHLLRELNLLGEFHACQFKDVCLGQVEDAARFLEAIRLARAAGEAWVADLGRVVPVEQVFHFTPDTLALQLKQALPALLERIAGGTLHVRLERRGLIGQVMSQEVEREVAEQLFALAQSQGRPLRASFEDPDYIIAAETIGNECGVALLTREMRTRYPFVQTR